MGEFVLFLGISLLLGTIISYYISRLNFPTITGLILLGVIFNFLPFTNNLFKNYSFLFAFIVEITPTILLFRTGVEFGFIRYPNKKILIASIIQPIITFSIVFLLVEIIFNLHIFEALTISTIWMVTGSDIAIIIIKQLKVNPETKIQLGIMTVFDDLIAEICFFLFFPLLKFYSIHQGDTLLILKSSSLEVLFSIICGIVLGFLIKQFLESSPIKHNKLIIYSSLILIILGISEVLYLHAIIVALISGIVVGSTRKVNCAKDILKNLSEIDNVSYALFVIFAVASVEISGMWFYLFESVLILLIRFLAKSISTFFVEKLKLVSGIKALDIIVSLLPQSVLSIYFAYKIKDLLITSNASIFAITVISVIIFEVFGYVTIMLTRMNRQRTLNGH